MLEAGLPNITGDTALRFSSSQSNLLKGAFYTDPNDISQRGAWETGTEKNNAIFFCASRSNSIYGNSSTVQPPAISLIPQIRF